MSDAKSPPELSMDEILATIRRIIAEDEQPGGPAASGKTAGAAAAAGGPDHETAVPDAAGKTAEETPRETAADANDDIIELTAALNEDGTVRHLVPMGGTSRIAALREPAPASPAAESERGPGPASPKAASPAQPDNRD